MPALFLADETTGAEWRVWPDPDTILPGGIQETGSYCFELRNDERASSTDLLIDDECLEALRTNEANRARWRWSPGFHAGVVEAEIRQAGHKSQKFKIVTDPDTRKLTRDAFDTMVREVLQDTFALFSLSSFRKGIAKGVGGRPPAIARLEFIRSRIDEIEKIVTNIVRRPRRRLEAYEVSEPYYRASRATGPEILRSFRSGRIARGTANASRLPRVLKGALPATIKLKQRHSSLDIIEHRQMAACLKSWSSWLESAADLLERSSSAQPGAAGTTSAAWSSRSRQLSRRLRVLYEAPPFDEVGPSRPILRLSALFRNDPIYRSFYRLWQDLNLGIAAIFGDFLDLPLAQTFEIYELWCFLRLTRASVLEFGAQGLNIGELFIESSSGGVTLATGAVSAAVGSGWKILFQKQYREFWNEAGGLGSYSRTMAPDIVIARDATLFAHTPLVVLDAKYRIGASLNDALSSIHTYRDAIVREGVSGVIEGVVTAAYLLTPYLPAFGHAYRETKMPGRLFHPEYRATFRFGAMTLVPGMHLDEIRSVLRSIISDAAG